MSLATARAMLGGDHTPRFEKALDGWKSRTRPGFFVYLAGLRIEGGVYYGRVEIEAAEAKALAESEGEGALWLKVAWESLEQLARAMRKARGAGTLAAAGRGYEWRTPTG